MPRQYPAKMAGPEAVCGTLKQAGPEQAPKLMQGFIDRRPAHPEPGGGPPDRAGFLQGQQRMQTLVTDLHAENGLRRE